MIEKQVAVRAIHKHKQFLYKGNPVLCQTLPLHPQTG